MADIDIVPKKRSSIWMWVVLALIVLAVIFWLMSAGSQPTTEIGHSGWDPASIPAGHVATPA